MKSNSIFIFHKLPSIYYTRKMTHSSTTHRSGECCAYAFAVWFSGRCSFSGTKILSNIALSLIHCAPFLACLPLLSISLSNGLLVLMIFLVLLSYKPQCMRQFTLRSNKLLMLKLNKIVIHTHTHNAHWENIITLCSGYMLVSWWRYFRLFAITAAATTATIVTT